MKICVCDASEEISSKLIKNITDCFLTEEDFRVKCFFSNNEMLAFENKDNHFDVYFISGDNEGILAAEIIRRYNKNAIIVFFAENNDHILDAFKIEALYYLVKPYDDKEFSELFRRIIVKYKSLNEFIHLRFKNERYTLKISDIIYIEGYNRHLTFYTKDEEFYSVGRIQNIFEKLSIHGFVRIHQGYTVNMRHIKSFGTNEVTMSDGTKVMISARRRAEALQVYDSFLSFGEQLPR
ncbi:MAG: response regulator transcription factor [Ruminococcaceae bacterium]|nr:response regulator transcription factor [Oscillospiraceae bacterium]